MASDDLLQHLSRSAGLSAYLALWLDMCLGVSLAGKVEVPGLARWRVADLHQFASLVALGLLAAHIGLLVGLEQQAFTVPELFVPLLRQINPLAPLLGITGLYVLVLVILISHGRRHVGLRLWRLLHTLSFAGFAVALAHAIAAGPDATVAPVDALYVITVAILVGLTIRRMRRKSTLSAKFVIAAPE